MTMALKWIIKKYYGWEHKSDKEQRIIKDLIYYRIKNVIARLACLFPLPIGILFSVFGSDKQAQGKHHYGASYGKFLRASAIGQSSSSRSALAGTGTELAGRPCWPGR